MKKALRYIGLCLLIVLLSSCNSEQAEVKRAAKLQAQAEAKTTALCEALNRNAPLDTIRSIAEEKDDVLFYVFDAQQMVYWSSNRLASDAVYLTVYDVWREKTFSNAKALTRWTRAGTYNVLTVLPLSYTDYGHQHHCFADLLV